MATYRVNEASTARYTATLVDETETPIPAADLTALTLYLYEPVSAGVVNSRNNQNVLNTNGVTVNSAGLLTWTISALDTTMVNATKEIETHIATFTFTYASGNKVGRHEVILSIDNLLGV